MTPTSRQDPLGLAMSQTGHITGCAQPSCAAGSCARTRLAAVGLRPTRPRLMLADRLFGPGEHRHVSAEMLHREVAGERYGISLATIYNTLNAFAEHGLLRLIEGAGDRTWFDTNTAAHHHFFVEGDAEVIDVPEGALRLSQAPEPPPGMAIVTVQVIVRLRRIDGTRTACCP